MSLTGKLMLGTVQFGLAYGVANTGGQVSYEEVLRILKTAHAHGVRVLDTAISYGNSELVLGKALDELGVKQEFSIITKIRHLPADLKEEEVESFVRASVQESKERLGVERLYGVLFHNESGARFLPQLAKLKAEGLVEHYGVSLDSLAAADATYECDFLQVPGNILDTRFDAVKTTAKIFMRSAFLQGLLLMEPEDIPAGLQPFMAQIQAFEPIRRRLGLSRFEFHLRYNLSRPRIDQVLFGVLNNAQLEANIRAAEAGPLPPDIMAEIEAMRKPLPETIVRPSCWPREAQGPRRK